MSIADPRLLLEELLENSLHFQAVEVAFFGCVEHDENEEQDRRTTFLENFKQLWQTLTLEQQNNGLVVTTVVEFANRQHTKARLSHLYQLLICIVEDKYIAMRKACEAVLDSAEFKFSQPHIWHETINLIKHFLPLMDYKSVRAIFSVLLSQVKSELPDTVMKSQNHLLQDVKEEKGTSQDVDVKYQIINMGLDRSMCLMPSYFVVNEIYKLYPVDNFHPHWALGQAFSLFTNSFKPLAQMVTLTGQSQLVPIVGHAGSPTVWNLDPATLKFPLKGPLPYRMELLSPQKNLLRYIIAQPYSRDIVCSMLGLKKNTKQRCEALEDLLVDLIIIAMEKTETMNEGDEAYQLLWQHLSSQLIFFILFQFASFPHMVLALHDKLLKRKLIKGRDPLMWVLLQFISGSIQKGPLSAFSPVMKLFDLLYPEQNPLPIPQNITSESTISFATACIWVHLSKKANLENLTLERGPPKALMVQLDYLQRALKQKQRDEDGYEIALLCNAYSTNPELFQGGPLLELFAKCYEANQAAPRIPGTTIGNVATPTSNVKPLEVKLLDSLTVHAKMSLINGIITRIVQVSQASSQITLAPALIETYGRLLIYMEIELLGIKGFLSQLLPTLLKKEAFSIFHTLLEMLSYRLHHIQPHFRFNLLSTFHSIAQFPFTEKVQLHVCIQNTILRLITGFGNSDVQSQLSTPRIVNEPQQILSKDCEELNKVLIFTIARAMHVTGYGGLPFSWCESILKEAIQLTPHRWSSASLSCFPGALQEFYKQIQSVNENAGKVLLEKVNLHFAKIKSLTVDEEIIKYFNDNDKKEILLWKRVLSKNVDVKIQYYMEDDVRAWESSSCILSQQQTQAQIQKRFNMLNEMIWKYDIIPFERLILSLTLRPFDDKNSQICFYIIKYLLHQPNDPKSFQQRVKKFTDDNSAQHWVQTDWNERHQKYQEAFPERFYFEGILEANNQQLQISHAQEYLPSYFGNVCLRFLPVFEILLQRLLELLPGQGGSSMIDLILKDIGVLFKFHDRPITFLYNTLHYYHTKLRKQPQIRKKLVYTVLTAQSSYYPESWACSNDFLAYLKSDKDTWEPSPTYYTNLVHRFIKTIQNENPSPFPSTDWRFNEFPNVSAHALFVTCVELMTLPISGEEIGKSLIGVSWQSQSNGYSLKQDIMSWINATSLILTSLPDVYLNVVNHKILEVVQTQLSTVNITSASIPLSFFDFISNQSMNCASYTDYLLAVFHVTWLHASIGQFSRLSGFLKTSLKPIIKNEAQLLYVFCLYAPFLQRFQVERSRYLFEVCTEFYYLLEQVCGNTTSLMHVDVITDFLYHIKYMFVGDNLVGTVEKIMPHLHESLQAKLRFMTTIKRDTNPISLPQQQSMEVINLTTA